MNTDPRGGAAAYDEADDNLEGRLSGRFAAELSRAEQDYDTLRVRRLEQAPLRRRRGPGPRLAVSVATIGVLAALIVVGVGLPWRPAPGPATAPPPAPSGAVMGSDGIPITVDGQRVFRVTDQAEWQNLNGSFLLGAFPHQQVADCPAPIASPPAAEAYLLPYCPYGYQWIELRTSASAGMVGSTGLAVAPHNSELLTGATGSPAVAVVVRVHTHDPQAAGCSAEQKAACEATVVVEAVVWPYIPSEIAGEHVYRAFERNSFDSLGTSFLLGGVVTEPKLFAPCPEPINRSDAEQQLIPYCIWVSIDAQPLAPMGVAVNDLRNQPVVVRAHVHDPAAAQCPAEVRADCQSAIVVEAVVWQGPSLLPGASPTPTAGPTGSPNPAASETAGPASTDQLGPDGLPTQLDGQPVYRASNLPAIESFLLGGKLTRDASCKAPSTPLAKAPGCGYWMLDGVKVGTAVDVPESLLGQSVVARVARGRALTACFDGSCTMDTIVIQEIVWPVTTPTPPSPPAP